MRRIFLTIVLFLGALTPLTAAPGTWAPFYWEGLGPIDIPGEGFHFTTDVPVLLRVVDCCVVGDQFEVFSQIHGSLGLTSAIGAGDGTDSGAFDGDSAWAHPLLSKGAWILPGGYTYDIDISVVRLADGFSTGFGFVRIDPYLESEVPEPGTITLLSIGAVLLLIGHKRIRAC